MWPYCKMMWWLEYSWRWTFSPNLYLRTSSIKTTLGWLQAIALVLLISSSSRINCAPAQPLPKGVNAKSGTKLSGLLSFRLRHTVRLWPSESHLIWYLWGPFSASAQVFFKRANCNLNPTISTRPCGGKQHINTEEDFSFRSSQQQNNISHQCKAWIKGLWLGCIKSNERILGLNQISWGGSSVGSGEKVFLWQPHICQMGLCCLLSLMGLSTELDACCCWM